MHTRTILACSPIPHIRTSIHTNVHTQDIITLHSFLWHSSQECISLAYIYLLLRLAQWHDNVLITYSAMHLQNRWQTSSSELRDQEIECHVLPFEAASLRVTFFRLSVVMLSNRSLQETVRAVAILLVWWQVIVTSRLEMHIGQNEYHFVCCSIQLLLGFLYILPVEESMCRDLFLHIIFVSNPHKKRVVEQERKNLSLLML